MSLEAEIARIQLNSLPAPIVRRLLKRRDIGALVEAGSAEVGDLDHFRFSDVRDALAAAPLGAFVAVPTLGGQAISVARSADAMVRARGPSGVETVLPELSLLDPSIEVRLEGIRYLSERALPQWPGRSSWNDRVAQGALADSDFGLVLDELPRVAEPVLAGIATRILGGKFAISDLVPTSTTYYESLLGPVPWTMGVSQYVADVLAPHLANVFRKNSTWGLRCIQAASVSEAIDPVRAAADVSNEDLMSAVQAIGAGTTPFALLATYRLASARAAADKRFSPMAEQALRTLATKTCAGELESGLNVLLISLVRLTLDIVGQAEELAAAPPFWRRLAAFAHATLVLEAIRIPDASARELGAWCAKCRTREGGAVEILDHLAEPRWHPDALGAGDLWATALLGAIKTAPEGSGVPALSDVQLEVAQPRLLLMAGLPGPLAGARQNWSKSNAQVKNADLLDGVDSATAGGEVPSVVQVWTALAHHAQIYRFSDGLLARVRGLTKALKPQAAGSVSEAYALCCNVASTQMDLELAELAAASVIEASDNFIDPSDAIFAASIVVLAAGAAKDEATRLQWAGDRLLALAYRLPRGPCCAALAEMIAIFQRFIPLEKRRWGKALVVARSASA